ncbi:family S53 protease [Dentipellis sp. KUC8613]|nr:family S53 protease [Dentipellis sp. KUC8613]
MAKFNFLALLAVLAGVANASPHLARSMHVLHRRDSPPGTFVKTGPAPEDQVFDLRFALVQNDFATLEQKLYAVSTPGNAEYGHHPTKEEVEELVRPSPDSVSALDTWLSSHNLSSQAYSLAGDVRSVSVTVKQANALLGAEYSTFVDQKSGVRAMRTLSYSIPNELKGHANVVYPTTSFPAPLAGPAKGPALSKSAATDFDASNVATAPESCATSFNPSCAQQMYGIPTRPATQLSNRLGVIGLTSQWINDADLQMFLTKYRPDLPASTSYQVVSISGGVNNQSVPGDEADLDAQYTIGLASGVPVEFLTVGKATGDSYDEPFTKMIDGLLNITDLPSVLSISYTLPEVFTDFATANHVCNGFAQLGARGISVFVGSGDWGITGREDPNMCRTFTAMAPSSCPYITSVGGTQDVNPEVAWNEAELDEASGSGFSSFFPIPAYQQADVAAYQKTLPASYDGLYNKTGRAYPDVSARATLVDFVWQAQYTQINGTSTATPVLASIAALLNDELVAAGKSPIGFMNPFIYANKDAFNDITSGSNPGCNTNGFPAIQGWDAVRSVWLCSSLALTLIWMRLQLLKITGVGTPAYSKLKSALGL